MATDVAVRFLMIVCVGEARNLKVRRKCVFMKRKLTVASS